MKDNNNISIETSRNGGSLNYYGPYTRDKGEYVAIEDDSDYAKINSTYDVHVIAYDEDSQDLWTGWVYLPASDEDGFVGREFIIGDVGYAPTVGSDSVVFDGGDPEFSVIPLHNSTFINVTACDTGSAITSATVDRGGELNYDAHGVNQNGICINSNNTVEVLFGTGYTGGQLEDYIPAERDRYELNITVHDVEGLADLLVENTSIVFNNSNVYEGDIVLINATINNTGVKNATYFKVRFYDGNETDGTLLEEKTISLLEPNSSTTINATFDTSGKSGEHNITVWIDPDDFITSYDEDNTAYTNLTVNAVVDLTLYSYDIFFDSNVPSEGDIVNITAQIRNIGLLGNASSVRVKFFDDNPGDDPNNPTANQIGTDQIIALIENQSMENASVSWDTTGYSGYNDIYVWIDPFNTISEGNENNNKNQNTVVVDPPELEITSSDISFNETSPKDGTIVLINVTIHNTGKNYAYSVVANFYEGDPSSGGTLIGTDEISSIANLSVGYASVNWDTTGKAGNNDIYVSVDPANSIAEQNEANNNASTTFFVRTSAFKWWNTSWHYRVPVQVNKINSTTDGIIKAIINFTDEFRKLEESQTFDINSLRVIEYNTANGEVSNDNGGMGLAYGYTNDSSYNATTNANLTIEWSSDGTINAGEVKYYYVYFDSTNYPKQHITFNDSINLFWGRKVLAQSAADGTIYIISRNETNVNITNSTGNTTTVTVGTGVSAGVYKYPYGGGTSDNPSPVEIEADNPVLVYVKSGVADDQLYMPPLYSNMTEFYGICTQYMVIYNNGTGTASVNGTDTAWSGDTDTDDTFSIAIAPGQISQITCDGYDFFHVISNESLVIYGGSDEAGSSETKAAMPTLTDIPGYTGAKKGKLCRS